MFHVLEQYRIRSGVMGSSAFDGNNGMFLISPSSRNRPLSCIVSDGFGWEHVSVKAHQGSKTRIPTWHEMCVVKALFWDADDAVMQLHPPQSQWINNHQDVLHLWRPIGQHIPLPASILVGDSAFGLMGGTGR